MREADRQAPNRGQGLLGVFGGGLVIASYFLPSYLTANPSATPPYSSSDYMLTSMWSNISPALIGERGFDPQTNTYVTGQPHIFTLLLSTTPMLMAAIILALGVWALFQRSGPTRSALSSAAAVVMAFSLVGALNSGAVNPYAGVSALFQVGPLLSLGSVIFVLGVFISLVSAFLLWQQRQFA